MLLRAPRNAYLHLRAGVTTVGDCGARNRVTFDLRQGAEAGLFLTPRLQLCGRPLTITGGHFWWCNEEADGVDGVRQATRKLLKEGADFIKIMASGGAANDSWFASYSVAELSAAVEEAHQVGKEGGRALSGSRVDRPRRRRRHRPDRAFQFPASGWLPGVR
jgi:imidazolonepropionase-like amidohydrolase